MSNEKLGFVHGFVYFGNFALEGKVFTGFGGLGSGSERCLGELNETESLIVFSHLYFFGVEV